MKLILDRYTKVEVWWHAVLAGYTVKDKLTIFLNRILHLTYPIVRFFYIALGIHIFSPKLIVKQFTCRNEYGIFVCPGGGTDIEFTNDYEPSVREIIKNLSNGTYVDVGSHVGLYTIMASKILSKKGKVIAIEPNPRLFELLERNVKRNHCDNVILKNIAAWDKNETLSLYEPKFGVDNVGNSLVQNDTGKYFEVEAIPLDEIISGESINLIKVDVEGAEPHVWNGLKKTLIMNKSVNLIFEALTEQELKQSTEILVPLGFEFELLQDGNYHAYRKGFKQKVGISTNNTTM